MKRKLICLLLVILILSSQVGIAESSNTTVNGQYYDVLSALNIVPAGKNLNEIGNSEVGKAEFIGWVLNFGLNTSYTGTYDLEALQLAEKQELISSYAAVSKKDILTVEEAATIITRLLGYELAAQSAGGYPTGYMTMARRIGVMSNVGANGNITYNEAFKLLYNSLKAKCSNYIVNGFVVSEQPIAITHFKGIEILDGVRITANEKSGILSESRLSKGMVKVDDEVYLEGDSHAGDYLGRRTEIFVKKTDDYYPIIVCVRDLSTKSVEISGDLIEKVDADFTEIEYYETNDATKTRTVKIAANAIFLKNGAVLASISADDFQKEGAKVTLTATGPGSVFDLVEIESYDSMILASTAVSSEKIVGEYTFEGALRTIDLSLYESENVHIYRNGTEVSLAGLVAGDVLSVYTTSLGYDSDIRIYAEDTLFTATVDSVRGDGETIIAQGKEYKLSKTYKKAKANNEILAQKIMPGMGYNFRLDASGKILSAVPADTSDLLQYGYVTKVVSDDDGLSDEYLMRLFMQDGSWKVYSLADKVKINGANRVNDEAVFVHPLVASAIPGLVGIRVNSEGEIKELEVPVEYTRGMDAARLNTTGSFTLTYRVTNHTFANEYYVDGGTPIFIIPKDDTTDESLYAIDTVSSLFSGTTYTFTGYNCDEFHKLDFIVKKGSATEIKSVSEEVYMVKDKGQRLAESGESVPHISVASGTYSSLGFDGEDGVFDGVEVGDLIRLHVNNNGRVDNCMVIYNPETHGHEPAFPTSRGSFYLVKGTIIKTDASAGWILLDAGQEVALPFAASNSLVIYDTNRESISLGGFADMEPGDFVVVTMTTSAVKGVAVYR